MKKVKSIKLATHLAILFVGRHEFDRQRKSLADQMRTHLAILFANRGVMWHFNLVPRLQVLLLLKSLDKIAQPDWLSLLMICSDERRKSRERAHMAIAGEFNRRDLTLAILYADRGDQQKSQLLHRAHLAIFGDQHIKSPSVSLA